MTRRIWRALATVLAVTLAPSARAHHGVAAVGIAGPEGPGAAIETTSPLPLPQGAVFGMVKTEYVPYQQLAFAEPTNKQYALFSMAGIGWGIRPWLTLYAFQPYNVKAQETIGRNQGPGDPNLMLSLAFKWDDGLQLVPEKESLDDLEDWHFSTWVASTIPLGATDHLDASGAPFAPDMQIGFGRPSATIGVAAMKQLSPDLTWLADASYQHFVAHDYGFTRYQFGAEARLDTAAVYRMYGRNTVRLDVAGELNGLHLQRDRERSAAGGMEALAASGGAVLYGGVGVRLYWGRAAMGLGIRRAVLKRLNEQDRQQGSEGLERFRAAFTMSVSGSI